MKIGVFLSDDRMHEICHQLKLKCEVIEIDENDSMVSLRKRAPLLDAVVFPVGSIEESGFVQMKSRGLFCYEFLEYLKEDCVIFAGRQSDVLDQFVQRKIYWLNNDETAKKNAELTAEALFSRIIQTTGKSIRNYQIDLIGTGKCASEVAKICEKLNLTFRMVTRTPKDASFPYPWIELSSWLREDPYDLIVNTAPACLVDQKALKNWKSLKHVYDLSSPLQFVDHKVQEHPFVCYHEEPSLPSRFMKDSAAQLIVDLIVKEMGI